MKARKILVSLAALALVAAISIGGTLAYLTSTQSVKNTFTVGNVSITLDEAKLDKDGMKLLDKDGKEVTEVAKADRTNTNTYKLLPGHSYVKDPTVTVLAGSEESYVRMLVTVTFGKTLTDDQLATKLDGIFTGYNAAWVRADKQTVTVGEGDVAHTVITYEYRYKTTVSAGAANNVLPALFTGITVPGDWNGDTLAAIGGFTIGIEAQAIQADGMEDATDAWAKFPNA